MWEHPTASGCDWRQRMETKNEEEGRRTHCIRKDHNTRPHTAFHLYIGTHGGGGSVQRVPSLSIFQAIP